MIHSFPWCIIHRVKSRIKFWPEITFFYGYKPSDFGHIQITIWLLQWRADLQKNCWMHLFYTSRPWLFTAFNLKRFLGTITMDKVMSSRHCLPPYVIHFWKALGMPFDLIPQGVCSKGQPGPFAQYDSDVTSFELFHWFFAWFHIVCDRYTSGYAHFTFSDTFWPLSHGSEFS